MPSLSWDQVNAGRLARHGLLERADRSCMIDLVRHVIGFHAQVMSAAELQLCARLDGLTPADVQAALWQARSLVKAWSLRGTLHLLPVQDYPLYVALLDSNLNAFYRRRSWLKYHQVTLAELDAIGEAIRDILSDKPMTREQLTDVIAGRTGSEHLRKLLLSGWGALLKPSALHGDLCFGPSQGQHVTFVRPAAWIGPWKAADPQEAAKELARRFLASYGPATPEEFGRWFGIQPRPAKHAFKSLGDAIEEVNVEGWQAWALVESRKQMGTLELRNEVRLLPSFDPYTIAVYPHRQKLLPEKYKARVYRTAGWISPVVLRGGRIVGVWEYEKKRARIDVTVSLFEPSDRHIKQDIEAEAERLSSFLEGKVQVNYD